MIAQNAPQNAPAPFMLGIVRSFRTLYRIADWEIAEYFDGLPQPQPEATDLSFLSHLTRLVENRKQGARYPASVDFQAKLEQRRKQARERVKAAASEIAAVLRKHRVVIEAECSTTPGSRIELHAKNIDVSLPLSPDWSVYPETIEETLASLGADLLPPQSKAMGTKSVR